MAKAKEEPKQKATKKDRLKALEEEIMQFRPKKILVPGQQEDIRKLAQQEVIKLLKEYGLIK